MHRALKLWSLDPFISSKPVKRSCRANWQEGKACNTFV